MARISLTMGSTNANQRYAFRITEYGRTSNCLLMGNEFNPLQEKDYLNRVNPYQDPTRGRINKV